MRLTYKRTVLKLIMCAALALTWTQSAAQQIETIYRCIGEGGSAEYTDVYRGPNCSKLKPPVEIEIGMTKKRVEHLLGPASRQTFVKTREDRIDVWYYNSGLVVTFKNSAVNRVEQN